MKKTILTLTMAAFAATTFAATPITISTDNVALRYTVGDDGTLRQSYFGKRLADDSYASLGQGVEAFTTHGYTDQFEPALHINHADNNSSLILKYVDHKVEEVKPGVTTTTINLADPVYNDAVSLVLTAYAPEDIITCHSVITNNSGKDVTLEKYASSMLHFYAPEYYLTEFSGDWGREAAMSSQPLRFGKKVIDTKLGSRANAMVSPFFMLSLDKPATETAGDVVLGTLSWTGNFRFTFEIDQMNRLRVISGINPYYSAYRLKKGETFVTPDFVFTYSDKGVGQASRNFHNWARNHKVKDGNGDRLTLLNNWEVTGTDFNEEKLVNMMHDAKELGVNMFLLDDGWFGNKYPRDNDHQGLGDWDVMEKKLPNGFAPIIEEGKKLGVKFGLWIEPEMVNPKSELYDKHPDWAITLPNRDIVTKRNQLVLDLSNPKVQDYVFSVVDKLLTDWPDIAYFKWDCNAEITNIYSHYLGKDQQHLYVDHVRGLYKVLDRIKAKYPDVPMMMCASGGGRCDFQGLEYFTEFWTSDDTDPVERLYIQYGMGHFMPSKVLCAHVATWNGDVKIKFRTNVAMMGKLGYDYNIHEWDAKELAYSKQAVKNYEKLKPAILDGDLYRLVSPYSGNHACNQFMSKDGSLGAIFTFDIYPRWSEHCYNVKLQGLDPGARYELFEIDRFDADDYSCGVYTGEYLMEVGVPILTNYRLHSRVYELRKR
ncbi:MAG: alpha-galactosidase [Bacteroidales bacterium]|nr:alpha-galactosidase [Bacteroidales bacterium]